MGSRAPSILLGLVLLFLGPSACGVNEVGANPDAERENGDLGAENGDSTVVDRSVFPSGPYGIETGQTLQNMTFAGYVNESPSEGLVTGDGFVDSFSLQDVRELVGYRFALINLAAEWCIGCRDEAKELPGDFARWADKGGFVMSIMTENQAFQQATRSVLDDWIAQFEMNYTMLHDPAFEIPNKVGPTAMPVNIMVDLDTMEIIRIRQGDDPEFFAFFESQLEK